MNLTRTRVARILMVGATLGMTIGLASSGLTAAAADDPEPPTAEQATGNEAAIAEPAAPPPTEPAAEPVAPTTEPVAEVEPPAAEPPAQSTPPVETEPSAPPSDTQPATTESVVESPAPEPPPVTTAIGEPSVAESSTPDAAVDAPSISPLSAVGGPRLVLEGFCDASTFMVGFGGSIFDSQIDVEGYPFLIDLPAGTQDAVDPDDSDGDGWIDVFQTYSNGVETVDEWWYVSVDACTPSAPTGLTAPVASASGSIALAWSAPNDGGAAITDYVIQRSPTGSSTWTTVDDDVSAATTYTVTGLTGGTRYYFRVLAENGAGSGPWSNVANAVARTAPSAVRSLTATPGNRAVTLRWTAPASNGGAAISGYIVQRSPNGTSSWGTIANPSATTTSYTSTGLINGTRYYFRVLAKNLVGNSASSNIANAIPRTVPTAPRSLRATPGSTKATLTWAAPASNGGAAVTRYVLQRSTSATSGWINVSTSVPATARSFTATGLRNGTRYYFRIAAVNAAGVGSFSAPVAVTPRTVPSAPTGLHVEKSMRWAWVNVELTWATPSNGGSPITGYVLQSSTNNGPWVTEFNGPLSENYLFGTVDIPPNGMHYRIRLAARNAVGLGQFTAPVSLGWLYRS